MSDFDVVRGALEAGGTGWLPELPAMLQEPLRA